MITIIDVALRMVPICVVTTCLFLEILCYEYNFAQKVMLTKTSGFPPTLENLENLENKIPGLEKSSKKIKNENVPEKS